MLRFIKENMSHITKMIVNQIGMTFFAFVVSMATQQSDTLFVGSSVLAILFYMFLIYTVAWEIGARDKIRLDGGRIGYTPLKGAKIALAANALNILLGVLATVGYYCIDAAERAANIAATPEWAASLYSITNIIARVLQTMYIGVIQVYLPNNPVPFIFTALPAIVFAGLGYFVAIKGKTIHDMLGIKIKPKNNY